MPEFLYVPAGLATAGVAVFLANRAGVSMYDMGLERSQVAAGLKYGLYSVVPIAAVIAAGVAIPWTREMFLDTGVVGASTGKALYEMLIRIPIGTALCEELIFRGALLGVFLRNRSTLMAVWLSSAVFGLWHVSPTLQSLSTNPAAAGVSGLPLKLGIVIGVVAATTGAGAGLSWLRLKSKSIIAPWIAHTCLNSFAYLGGRIAAHFTK
ncbi:MAG: CPBP family intramembrane metalloprotease [Actinobacteria bacterium]|nr:CPBP family intramembrane metalloprotease [Actinomycetota bacterium]